MKKALNRLVAHTMLHHYSKLQKNLMKTLGGKGFQKKKISKLKKFIKIRFLRKIGKSLHRIREHYGFHYCVKFEKDLTISFGGVMI